MVRSSSSSKAKAEDQNPDSMQRTRLKKLAFSNNLLSQTTARPHFSLPPSKTVLKHHGKDILRKSQRKNRFLFSFPGLLAPVAGAGGKIGELKDLSTKNPILYLDFPQGQLKLFGTIVYPKNRYLTLHFSRGGKNVVCEDYFDNMVCSVLTSCSKIVFSDAWWIGKKEENPDEFRLDFPKELVEGQSVDWDFKAGAGAELVDKQFVHRSGKKYVEEESPEPVLKNEALDDGSNLKGLMETTPLRHSERTAGKTFKFVEVSSGDDSIESNPDASKEDEEVEETEIKTTTTTYPVIGIDNDNEGAAEENDLSGQNLTSPSPGVGPKNPSRSSVSLMSKEDSLSSPGSLVQPTISTLFKKVQEKKKTEEKKAHKILTRTTASKVSGQKLGHADLKRKTDMAKGSRKRGKLTGGAGSKLKKKSSEVEDDNIEEFSSSSQEYTQTIIPTRMTIPKEYLSSAVWAPYGLVWSILMSFSSEYRGK
ncbi:hypothetical protein K2173_027116 [Erythroxylum novogranatense]|uniref:DNA-binding protein RHL1 n=1 Tax=Erythroxylum novogranatense TaxID=1862640 RepID=A0AAV8U161_9ROSI|nr:hypothetical protein K2173_027116 [Erythroxylum novogranatense]